MKLLEEIRMALISGDHKDIDTKTMAAIEASVDPVSILNLGLISGMDEIGKRFRAREIFLPQVLLAARAMNAGMDRLSPLFTKGRIPSKGRVVLGTVKGDLHDIGKNLVGVMLKGGGYEVIDLGKNVSPEQFVETALERKAEIIGLSALLTTTVNVMGEVIDLLKTTPNHNIMTVVGGAPVSDEFAKDIGADGYAFDAMSAVDVVGKLVGHAP